MHSLLGSWEFVVRTILAHVPWVEAGTSPGGHHVLRTVNQCSLGHWLPRAAGEVGLVAAVAPLWQPLSQPACLTEGNISEFSSPVVGCSKFDFLSAFEKNNGFTFHAFPPFRWARDVPAWPWSTTCWSQFRGSLSTGCCWQVGSPNPTSQLTLTALIEYGFPKHAASHSPQTAAW